MLISNLNERKALLVLRFLNPYDPADFTAYLAEFARVVAAARVESRPVALLIDVQDGYPQPNAVQRKSVGEAWASAPDVGGVVGIVTGSVLVRGIITVVEWFMKNSKESRETQTFSSSGDAITWLAERSGLGPSEVSACFEVARTRRVAS